MNIRKRIGHMQLKILILIYDNPVEKADIYNLVFDSPEKDGAVRSRVAKSLIRLKNHELVDYRRNYNNAKVSITEKGKKKVKEMVSNI